MKNSNTNEKKATNNTKILNKKDIVMMLIVTLIYAIISFVNLGSFTNPQTFWKARKCKRRSYYKT